MKAITKRRRSKTERDFIKSEVDKIYRENMERHEDKMIKRFQFWFMVSLCKTMDEEFGFGEQRINRLKQTLLKTMNDVSEYLISNTCETKEGEQYDYEYNRTVLQRLADQYGVEFNEELFDDEEILL